MTAPERTAGFREAEIDLAQLGRNVTRFRERGESKPLVVDVGANAWGHGLEVVVPALVELGAHGFVVARLDEAERIRLLALDALIITTQHAAGEDFGRAAALGVSPAVRSRAEFDRSVAAGVRTILLVADHGAGLPALGPDELRAAAAEAQSRGVVALTADAVAMAGPELLGVSEDDGSAEASGYRPVLRLWGPVAATKRVGAGEGVSYGYTYRTTGQTTLALVTLGYSDGISRSGGNRVLAAVSGATHTVAGRVAMDAFMLDLGDVPAPALGTQATVLGDAERGEPTALQQARILGMHSAEITTRLTARPRRYAVGVAR